MLIQTIDQKVKQYKPIESAKPELLDKNWKLEVKELCRQNLRFLCKEVLNFKDWDICHDGLESFFDNSSKSKKLILLPRGHLKTSIITIGKTIQHILQDENTSVLLTNVIWDNARSFLSEIKDYLTSKSILPVLFGKFESTKWTADEIIINQRTVANKTPTVSTSGADRSLTSQHYKIIMADDIVNRQSISTEDQREKTRKFYSELLDLLEPTGVLYLIGTRWHDSDLYGHVISNEKEQFDIFELGATWNGEVSGEAVFHNKFNSAKFKELLQAKGSYEFYSQYFNKCLAEDSQHFKEPVRYWSSIEGAIHYISFDPATSENKDACDAVVLDACINGSNQLCAVEYCAFKKKNPQEMISKIFEFVSKYPNLQNRPKKVCVETNGGQEIYIKLLQDEMRARNVFFELLPIHQNKDKFSRIIALQPRWESGNLLLKQGMLELEEQLLRFPIAKRNDIVDALAMVNQVSEPIKALFNKVYIPPEYR